MSPRAGATHCAGAYLCSAGTRPRAGASPATADATPMGCRRAQGGGRSRCQRRTRTPPRGPGGWQWPQRPRGVRDSDDAGRCGATRALPLAGAAGARPGVRPGPPVRRQAPRCDSDATTRGRGCREPRDNWSYFDHYRRRATQSGSVAATEQEQPGRAAAAAPVRRLVSGHCGATDAAAGGSAASPAHWYAAWRRGATGRCCRGPGLPGTAK
jgi:hypothetical protein